MDRRLGGLVLGILLGILSGCGGSRQRNQPYKDSPAKQSTNSTGTSEPAADEAIQLFDVTGDSGIQFVHQDGSFGKFCLPETMTGGLALFDYDGDSLIDIYFCNGVPLDPSLSKNADSDVSTATFGGNALYRNLGGLKFRDVTFEVGLASPDFGLGVTVGDYDNDGFADFYTSNFGRNALYRNNGDGSFARIQMQIENANDGDRFASGASFADFNRDGNLDLFVGNYVRLLPSDIAQQAQLTRTQYPGPQDFEPETNLLFQSLGDGLWSDRSAESNISKVRGTAMGTVTGDLDDDGDIDIYVANDELPNFMFRNNGQGIFEESAFSLGVAVDGLGAASGSMGVDAGDLNNDGRTDLFVTTFENELVTLYQMTEHAIFQDVTIKSKVGDGTKPHVTWGCCIADFENDGDRDLYIASGHLDQRGGGHFYQVQDLLMKNLLRESNKFEFANIVDKCGDMQAVKRCSRGSAVADLDNDGDLDVVALNLREKTNAFRKIEVYGATIIGCKSIWLELVPIATLMVLAFDW